MRKLLLFFALTLSLAFAYDEDLNPYPYAFDEHHIINLGEPTWDHAQRQFPDGLIVYFYEPYCLPCRKFWLQLQRAADSLRGESRVQLAKVECHDEVKLCEAKGVSNYPTIILYRRDKSPYEYRGPRTAYGFKKWVEKVIDGKYETVNDEATLFSRFSTALLLNNGNEDVNTAYKDLLDDVEIVKAGGNLESETGGIGAIITQGGTKLKISGSAAAIKDNINDILYGRRTAVPTFGARHSNQLQGSESVNFVLFFRTDKFTYNSEAARKFDQIAQDRGSDSLQFAYVNVVDDILGSTMGRLFGVKADSEVTVGIASKQGKVIRKYKLTGGVTEDSINNLLEDMGKKDQRYYMSAPAPTETPRGGSGTMVELVGSNFNEVVNNKDLNVLVMFYFPWCEWCVKLEPTWKALAYRYRKENSMMIARLDVSQNDVDGFDLSEFPVIVFYEAKQGATYQEYLSDRTMTKLKQFLENKIPSLNQIEL